MILHFKNSRPFHMYAYTYQVSASRVTFAYARDGCFPGSFWIKRVNQTTQTPVNAVWFNTSIGILMTLLIFGGPLAVGALFSIGAIAAFVAFTIPISIRVFFVGDRFRPGPWNLGKYSMYIGGAACAFVALMVPILMLPSSVGSNLKSVAVPFLSYSTLTSFKCIQDELDMSLLWSAYAFCNHLVDRRCPEMVQGTKGKFN